MYAAFDQLTVNSYIDYMKGGITMRYDLIKKNVSENLTEATLYKEGKDLLCPAPMNGGACLNEGICYPEGVPIPTSKI